MTSYCLWTLCVHWGNWKQCPTFLSVLPISL